jgi:hypothetical protein
LTLGKAAAYWTFAQRGGELSAMSRGSWRNPFSGVLVGGLVRRAVADRQLRVSQEYFTMDQSARTPARQVTFPGPPGRVRSRSRASARYCAADAGLSRIR